MSYLRFILFVVGITIAIGASAKIAPKTLERLTPSEPPLSQEEEPSEVDDAAPTSLLDDQTTVEPETPPAARPDEVEPAETWPDTFPFFVLGIAMAACGVVLWHWELRQERSKRGGGPSGQDVSTGFPPQAPSDVSPASHSLPLQPLIDRMAWLEQFVVDAENLRGWEIMRQVDAFLETSLLPVVERRQEIMNQYGTSRGAEILIAIAYGERMMNRVWSAAADGHLPEARSSLPEALEGFQEVQRLAAEADQPLPPSEV
jgi:hypothetical protein